MQKIFFPSSRPRFVDKKKIFSSLKITALSLLKEQEEIEKIFLFGSFATGQAGLRSDADILIVVRKSRRRMFDRIDEFILRFTDAPVPVDVLAYTQEELDKMLNDGNPFIRRILQEGILLGSADKLGKRGQGKRGPLIR